MPSIHSERRLSRCAIEPAESGVERKPLRTLAFEEKDYDPGLGEGDDLSHTYPVDPEPSTPRKPPAPLAFLVLVAIGCVAFATGLSCPFTCPLVGGGAFAPFGWPAGARWGATAFGSTACFTESGTGGSGTTPDWVPGAPPVAFRKPGALGLLGTLL
jgi:hypothetical protein